VVHPRLRLRHTISEAISDSLIKLIAGFYGFLVALSPVRELLFCAKHLFAAAMVTTMSWRSRWRSAPILDDLYNATPKRSARMSAGHHQIIRCRSREPASPLCELRFSMCFNREHAIACKVRNGYARDAPSPVSLVAGTHAPQWR
jgi:hypothetical protein